MTSLDSTESALDAPVSPGLQAMLDLAKMARAKPGTWKSVERGDVASAILVVGMGVLAWQSQSIPFAWVPVLVLVFNLETRVQSANERHAKRQLELILTVLRDLQRRVPVTSDRGA